MKYTIITLFSLFLLGHEVDPISPFDITVLKRGDNVQMICNSGCDWKEVKFKIDRDHIINSSGVQAVNSSEIKDEQFAFRVTNFKKGLSFKSMKGTAWKKLEYCNSRSGLMYLNEMGVGSARDKR